METIHIANDFSKTPGGRFISDGKYSGEEFRKKFLEPCFSKKQKIQIIFDGAVGYATSFLEEAFGGLARKYGKNACLKRLEFVSKEDPSLVEEIKNLIENS